MLSRWSFSDVRSLALLNFAIQWVMWAFSSYLQSEKYYDITGSVTYIVLIVLSYASNRSAGVRQMVQTGMVLAWAIRLGSFLFARISSHGFDRRFNGVRDNPPKFFVFWTLQGVWVIVTLLPSLLVNTTDAKRNSESPLNSSDYTGWLVWITGFIVESVADYQKSQFRAVTANKEAFITSGLWSVSRHPNYLGEILMWLGLCLPATNVVQGWRRWACFLCPFCDFLLLAFVSGVPPLEAYGQKKWGSDLAYQRYLKNTAVLIPYIW